MPARRYRFRAMGSPCELQLYDGASVAADDVAREAIAEVRRLERKYSRYRGDSVTSAINASAGDPDGVEVDPETAALLDYAQIGFEQSDGLFDITSGILRRAWDFKRKDRVPAWDEIRALLDRIGWQRVEWRRPVLVLGVAGMEIDFGGVVKEYAADRAAELCRSLGIHCGVVDLGGDLSIVGPHPGGAPWKVGVRDPRRPDSAIASVAMRAGGIASSGDYERCFVIDGKRYSHILDPKTGWPVEGLASVSVIATHCVVAGTASTIAMLKGAEEGPAWLDALGLPNVRMDHEGTISGVASAAAERARWAS